MMLIDDTAVAIIYYHLLNVKIHNIQDEHGVCPLLFGVDGVLVR